jgi:co-chaperonin GroES (HSP10)
MKPCGYQVLVKMQTAPKKTKSGLLLTAETTGNAEWKASRGIVVAMGPDAYTGNRPDGSPRFPTGPYCDRGDWVDWNRYQERRIHWGDDEYAVIADDRILVNFGKTEPPVW